MHEQDLGSIKKSLNDKMNKSIQHLHDEYKTIRTGRANISILDSISIDYYGQKTPLNQVGNITTPDPHTIVTAPWDKSAMPLIEKAIETSDLGINPANDGEVIRLPIPPLTEERRKEIIKIAKKKAEETKISLRNIRREANDNAKKIEKDGHISEDEVKTALDEIQKITDKNIKDVDDIFHKKEKDILEV